MFESARVKLTLFYLAVLLVFSLLLTWGFRLFVGAEFNHANDVQRGAFHSIGEQYFAADGSTVLPVQPDQNFAQIQRAQADKTQNRLTREAVLLNVGVLVVGAAISYWYAGRTLRPIEEAHERQKRFTSDASHELRTPLASMKLENELFLRQKQFSDQEVREQITSNLEEVARLERLTTSLLDLNRYESTPLKRQKVSTDAIAHEAIEHTRHAELAKQMKFKQSVINTEVTVDRESIVQLLMIVLDNAVKYGSAKGSIELNGAIKGGGYIFTVRDHGKGISEVDLPHIFERMYRGDKARSNSINGHGIGLSLAKQIATVNGATIDASNHPKGGAVFRIGLPMS